MIEKRIDHACFVDTQESTIHVLGGWSRNIFSDGFPLSTTEILDLDTAKWVQGVNLPEPLYLAEAVESKSYSFVGYIAGGKYRKLNSEIWGLRRKDMKWMQMSRQLRTKRMDYSLINVRLDEIPGCGPKPGIIRLIKTLHKGDFYCFLIEV